MTRVPVVRCSSLQTSVRLVAIASIVIGSSWLSAAPRAQGAQDPPLPPGVAQDIDWSDEVPAHLYVVDGAATLRA